MTETPAWKASGPPDVKTFWRVLGQRATGATVVTVAGARGPAGFLGLSASHVSAAPPTLLVSVDRKSSALAGLVERRHFAINYLASEQQSLADLFARHGEGHDQRFASPDWTTLETGAPVLSTALGAFDCVLEQAVELEGAVLAIGRAVAWLARAEGEPLIYFRGGTR